MENLNAEQIKYCLELILKNGIGMNRDGVDVTDIKRALALITSQEQKIKELAEEKESLKQAMEHEHASFMEIFGQYGEKCDKLTEENERLREELAKSYKALDESVNFYCSFTKSKIQNYPIDKRGCKSQSLHRNEDALNVVRRQSIKRHRCHSGKPNRKRDIGG